MTHPSGWLARASSALVLLLAPGCISFTYERDRRYERLPDGALATLSPGDTPLAECLARLGAPLWAWEDSFDGRPSAALAWGWLDEADWSVTLTVPVSDQSSVSFTWRDIDERMRGAVLFFDAEWRLVGVREGLLRDLYASAGGRPPAWSEELEEGP
jgi:hypothetical protein